MRKHRKSIVSIVILLLLICACIFVLYKKPNTIWQWLLDRWGQITGDPYTETGEYYTFQIHGEAVPVYYGKKWIPIHQNHPFFTEEEKGLAPGYAEYDALDWLGRPVGAMAVISQSSMPEEPREQMSFQPVGWAQQQYDFIDNGGWLYNRCHLIAYSLTGEMENPHNMITGTRQMNLAMLPFEVEIAQYVERFHSTCLYRVTPYYEDANLLAAGVLLECDSGNLFGDAVFCVFIYNVQDGVTIDYRTGENWPT